MVESEKRKEMGEGNWAGSTFRDETDHRTVILQVMYSEPKTSVGWVSDEDWEYYMAEKTGLNKMAVRNARLQLEQIGLIQESEWFSPRYVLTREGYKIAHEQEMMRRQLIHDRKQTTRMEKTNKQYNYLAFLLVIIGALEVFTITIRSNFDGGTTLGFYFLVLSIALIAYLTVVSDSVEGYLEEKGWFPK